MTSTSATTKPKKQNSKSAKTVPIRISKETRKEITKILTKLNKEKEFGRRIKADALVSLAIERVRPEDLEQLKESSMSNKDRLELKYREYVKRNGSISKDEFYGLLLEKHTPSQDSSSISPDSQMV